METMDTYRVGTAAKAAGVHVQTLHFGRFGGFHLSGLFRGPRVYPPENLGAKRSARIWIRPLLADGIPPPIDRRAPLI